MLRSWKSITVGLIAYWVWTRQHALKAQLLPKDIPKLFDAGASCTMIGNKEANGQFKFCEDGTTVAPGVAIFSCDPGRLKWNTIMGPMIDPNPRGGLWAVHYDSKSTQTPYALELSGFPANADFHPLGIEVIPSTEKPRVLVINHRRDRPTIEVFRIYYHEGSALMLTHEKTLHHPSIKAPNAMVAVSETAFYLSQDHTFTFRLGWPLNMFLPVLETMLALPLGRVSLVLFDTVQGVGQVQTIASQIPFANGVAISEDGSTLAVAATTLAEVQFYSRNQTSIDFVRSIKVPFSADNIAFAGDQLLVAGHPYLPAFMALKKGKTDTSPSWVSSISPAETNSGESWISRIAHGAKVTDILKSDGSFLTSSSGAFADLEMQTMFVVGLYDGNGVAKCKLVS
ncbi:hypothetical protein FRC12_013208 [Ceratobasidium sp. 428]|nr:hypothetical protein FRC12_013208 [Ceratobasidium sp. 428]